MLVLGWVSIFVALAILGMGGAPIAEKFGFEWLMIGLQWLSYISVGILVVATLLIGGIGIYHGILTLLGINPGKVSGPERVQPLPAHPKVEGPADGTA